jgi:ketosteroid isomerase-like protein
MLTFDWSLKLKKMKYAINSIFLPLIFLSVLSCQMTNSSESSINSSKEAVKQTLIDMWDAIEKEDIERYASFIHPDFTQFGETDSVLRVGKTAEVEGVRSWVENSSDIHTEMLEPRITVKGNVAWIVYYWSDRGITDGTAFTSKGKSTRIFVKEEGKWLCIHGHYTLLPKKIK